MAVQTWPLTVFKTHKDSRGMSAQALGCHPPHLPEITGVFHQGPKKDCLGECVASQTLAEVFRFPSFKSKNVGS